MKIDFALGVRIDDLPGPGIMLDWQIIRIRRQWNSVPHAVLPLVIRPCRCAC